jgi:hypothetical protein
MLSGPPGGRSERGKTVQARFARSLPAHPWLAHRSLTARFHRFQKESYSACCATSRPEQAVPSAALDDFDRPSHAGGVVRYFSVVGLLLLFAVAVQACSDSSTCRGDGTSGTCEDAADAADGGASDCTGTATPCANLLTMTECSEQAGCGWSTGMLLCRGTVQACATLPEFRCASQRGCSWR